MGRYQATPEPDWYNEEDYLSKLDPLVRECRETAIKALAPLWAKRMNDDYGPFDGSDGFRAYTPEDMLDQEVEGHNRAPMSSDLLQFTIWLRYKEYGAGPQDLEPGELETLAKLTLEWTGE